MGRVEPVRRSQCPLPRGKLIPLWCRLEIRRPPAMVSAHPKHLVVTGASSGIGRACALRAARAGWRVFGTVRRDEDARALEREGGDAVRALRMDVTDADSIEAAAAAVQAECGGRGLDGLVNNAGIVIAGPLEYLPVEDFRHQIEVNLVGPLRTSQALLPQLRAARGRIVMITSISGKVSYPMEGPYCASKHALESIAQCLRMELAPSGVGVSVVAPGPVRTPIWERSRARAAAVARKLPPQAWQHYGSHYESLEAIAEDLARKGIPADRVARSVEHALTSGRPRTRYIVGFDATIQRILSAVAPDRLRDRLVAMQLKLPSKL